MAALVRFSRSNIVALAVLLIFSEWHTASVCGEKLDECPSDKVWKLSGKNIYASIDDDCDVLYVETETDIEVLEMTIEENMGTLIFPNLNSVNKKICIKNKEKTREIRFPILATSSDFYFENDKNLGLLSIPQLKTCKKMKLYQKNGGKTTSVIGNTNNPKLVLILLGCCEWCGYLN